MLTIRCVIPRKLAPTWPTFPVWLIAGSSGTASRNHTRDWGENRSVFTIKRMGLFIINLRSDNPVPASVMSMNNVNSYPMGKHRPVPPGIQDGGDIPQ